MSETRDVAAAAERCLKTIDGVHCGCPTAPGRILLSADVIAVCKACLALSRRDAQVERGGRDGDDPPDVAAALARMRRIAAHENPYKVYCPEKYGRNHNWTEADEAAFSQMVRDDHARLAWAYVKSRTQPLPSPPTDQKEVG